MRFEEAKPRTGKPREVTSKKASHFEIDIDFRINCDLVN
ncbi:hypothetical protein SLEP1_g38566 [Rubroshorea leprosula]|nr:hypothetical protein SLEP1_g38566 [Rubroshorea leprosula]